jgi:hypothetical protein
VPAIMRCQRLAARIPKGMGGGIARVYTGHSLRSEGPSSSVFVRNSSLPQGRRAQALVERWPAKGGCHETTE